MPGKDKEFLGKLWETKIPSLLRDTDIFRDLCVQLPGRDPYKASKLLLAASSSKLFGMLQKEDCEALSRALAEDGEAGEAAFSLLELIHGQEVVINDSKHFFALFNLALLLDVAMCIALCRRAVHDNVVTSGGQVIRLKPLREDMLLLQGRAYSFYKAKPQMFSDVLLRVATDATSDGGVAAEEVGVHGLVFAAASPYHRSMWAAGFAEAAAVRCQAIDRHGIASVNDLVRFLYLGEYVAADAGSLKGLFVLADEYQVDDLATAALVEIEASQTSADAVEWLSEDAALPAPLEKAALFALGSDSRAADMPLSCAVRVLNAALDAQLDVQESLVRHARATVDHAIRGQQWTEESPLNALAPEALQDIIPSLDPVSVTGESSAKINISNLGDGSTKVERLNYDNNESADISVTGPVLIRFTTFKTEKQFDSLTIAGTPHSGSELPKDIQVAAGSTVMMKWQTDKSNTDIGWAFHVSPNGASLALLGAGIDMWLESKLEVESLDLDSELQPIVDGVPHLQSTLRLLQCLESSDRRKVERLAKAFLLAPEVGDEQAWGTCINLLTLSSRDGDQTFPKTLSNLCWDLALAQHDAMMSSVDAENLTSEAVLKLVCLASHAEVLPNVMTSVAKLYKHSSSTLADHLKTLPPIVTFKLEPEVDVVLRINAAVPRADAALAPFFQQALHAESSDSIAKLLIEAEGALPETVKTMLRRSLALRLCQGRAASKLLAGMPTAATLGVLQMINTLDTGYTWHVPDRAWKLAKGQSERSGKFRIGEIDGFSLSFYPRGDESTPEGKCPLFLSAPIACSISVCMVMAHSSKKYTEVMDRYFPEAQSWEHINFCDAPSGGASITITERNEFDIADFLDQLVQQESTPWMLMGELYEQACALQARDSGLEEELLRAIGRSVRPLESCLHVLDLDSQKPVAVSPAVLSAAQKAARTALVGGQHGRDWGRLRAEVLLGLVLEADGETAQQEAINIVLDEWASTRGDWRAEEPCEALPNMLSQKQRSAVTMAGVCSTPRDGMDRAGSLGMVQASLSSIFREDLTLQDAVAIMSSLEEQDSRSAWLRRQAVRTIAAAAKDGSAESIVPLGQVHLSQVLAEFSDGESSESISDLLSVWAHKGPEGSNKENMDDQLALLGSLPNRGALAQILGAAVCKFLDARPGNEARRSCARALNQRLVPDCEDASAILMEGAMLWVMQDMDAFSSSAAWRLLEPSAIAALLERSLDNASCPQGLALQHWVEAVGSAAGFRALRLVKQGSKAFDMLLSAVQAHMETLERHNAALAGDAYRKLVKENADLVAKQRREAEDLKERWAAANRSVQEFQKAFGGMQVALEKSVV